MATVYTVYLGLGVPRSADLDNTIELYVRADTPEEARDRAGEVIGQSVSVVHVEAAGEEA